jgi:hypothetical protein
MSAFVMVSFTLAVAAFAHQAWRFQHERAAQVLEDWARSERLVVLHAERRLLETGPFWAITAGDQPVYLVTVRTGGAERRVWVQCGELPWGVLSPTIAARWED